MLSPIFHNQNTISIERFSKLLITGDINLIKRLKIPLPKFFKMKAIDFLMRQAEEVINCKIKFISHKRIYKSKILENGNLKNLNNEKDQSISFSELVISCEILLHNTIDRNITLSEFRKYYKMASKKASQIEIINKN